MSFVNSAQTQIKQKNNKYTQKKRPPKNKTKTINRKINKKYLGKNPKPKKSKIV
jgi:hypothetical protein